MSTQAAQAVEFEFTCALANGLHARPASHLAETAARFTSVGRLSNQRSGVEADLKSVLSLVAADVRPGDVCLLRLEGPDQAAALAALRMFVLERLPACDEPLAHAAPESLARALPRSLASAGARHLTGRPVSSGIGQGKAVVLGRVALTASVTSSPAASRAEEHARIQSAFTAVRARIETLLARHRAQTEAAILKAHLAILGDLSLQAEIARHIDRGRSAAQAIVEAGLYFSGLLESASSAYIRERAIDVQELSTQLLEEICGPEFQPPPLQLDAPSILIAESLAPHQLLTLDRRFVAGIVLESAGATSHAVIVARSMGIPAVVGVANAARLLTGGAETIVDGARGLVFPHFPEAVARFYARQREAAHREQARLALFASQPGATIEGEPFEIGANISSDAEALAAFANGADGIGLFRTELLFARRDAPLTEDEQLEVYAAAARAANGRPVILRTADIGGDKPLPYLRLPEERNPFLGYRGIRIYPEHRQWLAGQLRAALRASAHGKVWIMAPMVATLEEAVWFKEEVERAKQQLRDQSQPFDDHTPIGAMIEVPSAAFQMKPLASILDFFSIGANDLSQYFYAADRENPKVSALANPRGPAFLSLLWNIAKQARDHAKWIGLCGEMAADPRNLPLLIGLGLNEISVSAHSIPALKCAAARLSAAECWELLGRAIVCQTGAEVEALLDQTTDSAAASHAEAAPLLSPSLVALHADARDKEEAIRTLVETLDDAGRIHDPDRMEEAIWTREAVYSTGLGHGLAIPHCQNAAVKSNSIAILKLDTPIEWGSLDGAAVRMVILLALREASQDRTHMKIFSKLARKLMDEEFRARLLQMEDPGELVSHLGQELEESL